MRFTTDTHIELVKATKHPNQPLQCTLIRITILIRWSMRSNQLVFQVQTVDFKEVARLAGIL